MSREKTMKPYKIFSVMRMKMDSRIVLASMDTSGYEYCRVMQESDNKKWRAFQSSVLSSKIKVGDNPDKPKKTRKNGASDAVMTSWPMPNMPSQRNCSMYISTACPKTMIRTFFFIISPVLVVRSENAN